MMRGLLSLTGARECEERAAPCSSMIDERSGCFASPAERISNRTSGLTGVPTPTSCFALFECLPEDVLRAVLLACETGALLDVACTCRCLHAAAEDDALWLIKIRERYQDVLPLFVSAPWMPLPAAEERPDVRFDSMKSGARDTAACHVRGERPKNFYFSFDGTWMSLASRASEVGGRSHERCVLWVGGRVYDVTDFVDEHPGEPYLLRAAAGTDATDAFEYANHSTHARSLLAPMLAPRLELRAEVCRRKPTGERRAPTGGHGGRDASYSSSGCSGDDGGRLGHAAERSPEGRDQPTRLGRWLDGVGSWLEAALTNADDKAASRRHFHCLRLLTT